MLLINTQDLDQTPIRVQRLLIRLVRFNFVCTHVIGKALVVAVALSRSKVSSQPQTGTTTDLTDDIKIYTDDTRS